MDLRIVFLVFATLIGSAMCSLSPSLGEGHYENRRSASDTSVVKIATAETDAKSDSEAGHGMASASSTTKGSAAFVSKDSQNGKHRRSARTLETVKIAIADTKAESDSKAKDVMALSSSSTKGSAAFGSKDHHRRSTRATEKVEVAVANADGLSDSVAKFPEDKPEKKLYGATKPPHHKEEAQAHPKENPAKVDHHVKDEGKDTEKQEQLPKASFFDLDNLKKIVTKLASVSVNL